MFFRKNSKVRKEKPIRDKDKYKVIGGLLGDHSRMTVEGVVKGVLFLIFSALVIIAIVKSPKDLAEMSKYKMSNTTPIGQELEFSKSKATLYLKDVWTDKDRDMTVVKLGYNKAARKKLSTMGENYHLHMIADKGHAPKVKVQYGILDTEGDGYLFIKGKLEKRAYQIVIANTLDLGDGNLDDTSSASKYADKSLSEAISKTSSNATNDKGLLFGSGNVDKEDQPKADNIDFRVNPYSDTTHVFKEGSFLNGDGSINYGKVVGQTSVKKVIGDLEKEISQSESNLESLEAAKKEYEGRLKKKKDNSEAKGNLENAKSSIDSEKENLKKLKDKKAQYENDEFDREDFGEMQENIKIHAR